MSGRRRPPFLPALLVALVTLTGCASTNPPLLDRTPTAGDVSDARPVAGERPADRPARTGPNDETPPLPPVEVDPAGTYETWLPVALDRLYERAAIAPLVDRAVVCRHVDVDDCVQLPEELPAAAVRMFDRIRDDQPELVAPVETLRVTAVMCLLLDDRPWEEAILLITERAEAADDLTALAYGLMALTVQYAVTFICPEHEAATREQMRAVICERGNPAQCAQFDEVWPAA